MLQKKLRATWKRHGRLIGTWLFLPCPDHAEIFAQSGFDCLMIDHEHGPNSPANLTEQLRAAGGMPCLVRIAENNDTEIKKVLDAGASGIMVPMVNSAADARQAVAAALYPPRGRRGCAAGVIRASRFGRDQAAYVRDADEVMIVCQIETRRAIGNIEEIAAVDGVDMLFIGPSDLGADMGLIGEADHPELQEAIRRAEDAILATGKGLAGLTRTAEGARAMFERGYSLVLVSGDTQMLVDGSAAIISALR